MQCLKTWWQWLQTWHKRLEYFSVTYKYFFYISTLKPWIRHSFEIDEVQNVRFLSRDIRCFPIIHHFLCWQASWRRISKSVILYGKIVMFCESVTNALNFNKTWALSIHFSVILLQGKDERIPGMAREGMCIVLWFFAVLFKCVDYLVCFIEVGRAKIVILTLLPWLLEMSWSW